MNEDEMFSLIAAGRRRAADLFDQATIHQANHPDFTIITKENGPQKYYIDGATLNGNPLNKVYISHDQILSGGELIFNMDSFPNYNWATDPESRPPSAIQQLQ